MPSKETWTSLKSGLTWTHSKVKCKVLHFRQGNPRYVYKLGEELTEFSLSPVEKDLVVQAGASSVLLWPKMLATSWAASKRRWQQGEKEIVPLCSDLLR